MEHEDKIQIFQKREDPLLEEFFSQGKISREIDIYDECIEELCEIEFPWIKPGQPVYDATRIRFLDTLLEEKDSLHRWVYYPWINTLVHLPNEKIYKRLRTSRNRNLITEPEQQALQSKSIGIAGMSVGSNIFNTLVLTGIGGSFKIADMDTISVPNLNRLMAPVHSVGLNKARFFKRRNLEVDPFLKIDTYETGLGEENFESFFSRPNIDLFIEEMDNPYLKIKSRQYAKQAKIPVIMAADNGDGVLIDVERFDLEPDRPLFQGRLESLNLDKISPQLTFAEKLSIIALMAGLSEATPRMQDSIGQVGNKLNTWPQLGTAALAAGVSLAFIARRILLGEDMPSGRYRLSLEEQFVPNYNSTSQRTAREKHTQEIMDQFNAFQEIIRKIGQL